MNIFNKTDSVKDMEKLLNIVINAIIDCFSDIFITVFRFLSTNIFITKLINKIPNSILLIGSKLSARSLPPSYLSNPDTGSIALVIQSGSLKIIILNQMVREGLGLSKMVYYYDKKNDSWEESNILNDLLRDKNTKVIMFCIESLNNGRNFVFTAKKISKKKPIIIYKSGRTEVTKRAVFNHVGALAGSDKIFDGAMKQAGCLRAQTLEEMLCYAKALSKSPQAKGSNVGIITNGAGAGIVAVDECIKRGLNVPLLPKNVVKRINERIPLYSGISNPLDLRVLATAEIFREAITTFIESNNIDLLLIIVVPTPALDIKKLVKIIVEIRVQFKIPILISTNGSDTFLKSILELGQSSIPLFLYPEHAAAGAFALSFYPMRAS